MPKTDKRLRELNQILVAVVICFFFSGAAGLVYEILWTRMLSLIFGSTTLATSTVLATFMGGLALGSFVFGRAADRSAHPLRAYALLEIGTGIYAVLVPVIFKVVQPVYLAAARSWQFSFGYNIFLFFLSAIILLVPTVLMGGTLPMMSKFLIRRPEAIGRLVGNLYALNSFGAVLGILAAGYLLLPIVGVFNLILMAAIINIGVGVLCYIFDRHLSLVTEDTPAPGGSGAEVSRLSRWGIIILVGFGLSGFASMVYEVAWTRALALSIGSSIYAFSIMLMTFIFGLAAGSLLFALLVRERRTSFVAFALLEAGIGFVGLLLLPLFDRLPFYFVNLYILAPDSYGFVQFTQFLLCFVVMILPALLFGASFPLVARILIEDLQVLGRRIGQAYSVNTIGCILGSFITGFVLIPIIGVQRSIVFAALINGTVALAITVNAHRVRLAFRLTLAAVIALVIAGLVLSTKRWNRTILNTGIALRPARYLTIRNALTPEEYLRSNRIIFYREGINCNVAIIKSRNELMMNINGKTDAGTGRDMATQLMGGYLPLFLHPSPNDVFILGLGSGITMGACSQYGVPSIECAEIEAAVIEGARFFGRENHDVVDKRRDQIFTADGRNYLLASRKKFDVISTEPSNPWMAGIANLFAREFYQTCKQRLKPNGIVCQWVQGYNLGPTDFQMIITTFRSVFPYVMVWSTGRTADYLLIGSMQPISIDVATLEQRMAKPAIQDDLRRIHIDNPYAVLSCIVLSPEGVDRFVRGGYLNSDDRPLLEFSAPRSLYAQTSQLNDAYLRRCRTDLFSDLTVKDQAKINYYNGLHLSLAGLTAQSKNELDLALEKDSTYYLAYLNRALLGQLLGKPMTALDDLEKVISLNPRDARAYQAQGRIYEMQDRLELAQSNFELAIRTDPARTEYRLDLVNHLIDERAYEAAVVQARAALASDSLNSQLLERLGYAQFNAGDTAAAIASLEKATEIDGFNAEAFYTLGTIYGGQKNNIEAVENLKQARDLEPMRLDVRLNLGAVYANMGRRREAADEFKKVLRIDPENLPAFIDLHALR